MTDVEALHEVSCPGCGTTIRARMADAAARPARDDTTEARTEYRVTGYNSDGRWVEREFSTFETADYTSMVWQRDRFTQVCVESRAVTTTRRATAWEAER